MPEVLSRNFGPSVMSIVRGNKLSGYKILIVEDEILIALDIEAALEDCGAIVHGPVTRLAEGVALAKERGADFDCAILDVNLQGEDVFPIAEVLCSLNVPFLFHTGHGDSATLQKKFEGVPVCNKPFQTERLVEVVAELVS